MSLPCARGGGRRGTSLSEGLLYTRKSDLDTPSASRSFGTSLVEGGKGMAGGCCDFCGIPEQYKTQKRKGPMSFLIGPFLAIGLSINQTVVS